MSACSHGQEVVDSGLAAPAHIGRLAAAPHLDLICLSAEGQPLWRRALEVRAKTVRFVLPRVNPKPAAQWQFFDGLHSDRT